MSRRQRKFIGAIAMLVFVCVYALVAMSLAQGRITELNGVLQMFAYAALGLGWILPLMPLIRWMEAKTGDEA